MRSGSLYTQTMYVAGCTQDGRRILPTQASSAVESAVQERPSPPPVSSGTFSPASSQPPASTATAGWKRGPGAPVPLRLAASLSPGGYGPRSVQAPVSRPETASIWIGVPGDSERLKGNPRLSGVGSSRVVDSLDRPSFHEGPSSSSSANKSKTKSDSFSPLSWRGVFCPGSLL